MDSDVEGVILLITKACSANEISHLIQEYIHTLSAPVDSFLEEHIMASDFYVVVSETKTVGYYAIHNNQLLTQFFVSRPYQRHAQEIFNEVLRNHSVTFLYVPTCDELFMSLALDKDFKITKQAYFFQDSKVEILENDQLREDILCTAKINALQEIKHVCGDFLDEYDRRIQNGEIFTYRRGATLLGIGVLEESKIVHGWASIGMYTNEHYRKQGIGRNIILKLKKWCYNRDLTPISGCWYYNQPSKLTLESAGMVTRTRLLKMDVV
jgi:GNAT superfamily N-acetyltransferase